MKTHEEDHPATDDSGLVELGSVLTETKGNQFIYLEDAGGVNNSRE